jgi:hypothetical protein
MLDLLAQPVVSSCLPSNISHIPQADPIKTGCLKIIRHHGHSLTLETKAQRPNADDAWVPTFKKDKIN